jgi:hypothetical protein
MLMGRRTLSNDLNPVAYCLTRAKTNAPPDHRLLARLTALEHKYDDGAWRTEARGLSEFFRYAYDPRTLRQILYLRSSLRWQESDIDCMLAALTLGALHGESERSPSYLSNQMPRTISTKPAYSVAYWKKHGFRAPKRNTFDLLRRAIAFRYESVPPSGTGDVVFGDMRDLPRAAQKYERQVACVITSPPYLDVTRFEEDQWLRIWFLGGAGRPTYGVISADDRHERPENYWQFVADLWRSIGFFCARGAHVVIRLGGKGLEPQRIADAVVGTAVFSHRKVRSLGFTVSEIQRRQTEHFRPGSKGCKVEVDCHLLVQ